MGLEARLKGRTDEVNEESDVEVNDEFVNPLVVQCVALRDLVLNERRGKLREIVDLRKA